MSSSSTNYNEVRRILVAHRRYCHSDTPREAWCNYCTEHAEHEVETRIGGTMALCDRHFGDPTLISRFLAVPVSIRLD